LKDNEMVAGMAKEMLETQGWYVDSCTDGNEGLERINGTAHYDLLLLIMTFPD
jgi:CheY-like chemotaxis protein